MAKRQKPTRAYSREFTPKTDERLRFTVDRVPAPLHQAVKAKAAREGVSLRGLILKWLTEWVGR